MLTTVAVEETIYTVPEGKTALVKSVRLVNTGASTRTLHFGVGGTAAAQRLLSTSVSAGLTYVEDREAPFVLHAGETLKAIQTNGQSPTDVTITLSGAEVTA